MTKKSIRARNTGGLSHIPEDRHKHGLVLDYNPECTPGKGSAIFLHCPKSWNNTGTSGCISIPEEDMKQVVRQVDAGTKIVVVQDEADLANY